MCIRDRELVDRAWAERTARLLAMVDKVEPSDELRQGLRDHLAAVVSAAAVVAPDPARPAVLEVLEAAARAGTAYLDAVHALDGEHAAKLDLKGGGVAALVELARVYALENGLPDVNTRGRLEATAAIGRLSERRAAELTDALEFVSYVRLRHQVRQHRAGVAPDNFVSPSELTDEERRHLKDVFQIIRRAQATLAARRPLHYVS